MTISYNTSSQRSGSKLARAPQGLGAPTRVAPGRGRSGEVGHERYRDSRTWGAERERSASTHALQIQFGKHCM
eukprot:2139331-Pleurochrysis_carterae.AAC.1